MDKAPKAVLAQIDDDKDHVVSLTQDLVRIPSVNPKLQEEQGLNRESFATETMAGIRGMEEARFIIVAVTMILVLRFAPSGLIRISERVKRPA